MTIKQLKEMPKQKLNDFKNYYHSMSGFNFCRQILAKLFMAIVFFAGIDIILQVLFALMISNIVSINTISIISIPISLYLACKYVSYGAKNNH